MSSVASEPLTWEELRDLQLIPTPSVANAIETFAIRPRSEGVSDGRVRSQFPELGPMVGYAATATIRSNDEAPKGPGVNRWHVIQHTLSIPSPRIVVVQDLDPESRRLGGAVGRGPIQYLQAALRQLQHNDPPIARMSLPADQFESLTAIGRPTVLLCWICRRSAASPTVTQSRPGYPLIASRSTVLLRPEVCAPDRNLAESKVAPQS